MLSVQNYNVVSAKPSFNAGTNENKKPSDKPFTTNAGLKTGAVYGGIGTLGALFTSSLVKVSDKLVNDIAQNDSNLTKVIGADSNAMKHFAKGNLLYIPFFIAATLGCGAIVDRFINKKNAAFAERLEKEGKDKVLKSDDNADMTFKKNVYYKSDTGKKIGTALGAVVMPALTLIMNGLSKTKVSAVSIASALFQGALGGLILGAITDNIANKNARKHADMQAKK